MEGFDRAQYDEILGLKAQGLASAVIATLGYRSAADKYAQAPKVSALPRNTSLLTFKVMRKILRLLAAVVILAAAITWAATGANRGRWTKNQRKPVENLWTL